MLARNFIRRAGAARRSMGEGAKNRSAAGVFTAGGFVVMGLLLASCDVTNPGPIQDAFLVEEQSHAPLVAGAGRTLTQPLGDFVQEGGVIAREVMPGGQVGAGAFAQEVHAGELSWENSGGPWNSLHGARFVAEYAIEIFSRQSVDASPRVISDANMFAGVANELLGTHFCQVAYDGGPLEPSTNALGIAEDYFTEAIAAAADEQQRSNGYAGRARTRLALGDWGGALSDAQNVPLDFVQELQTFPLAGERNAFAYGSTGAPHKSQTVRFTFYDTYYPESGDPRVAWETYGPDEPNCAATLEGYGSVPCSRPKYIHHELDDPLLISSGAEMLLIRAEALLMQSGANWPQALDLINQVRTRITKEATDNEDVGGTVTDAEAGQPLDPWDASSAEETWTVLMRERGIELWLTGKRIADLRRWEANGVPGDPELPDETVLGPFVSSYNPNDTCYPVPRSEVNDNPNIDRGDVIKSRNDV